MIFKYIKHSLLVFVIVIFSSNAQEVTLDGIEITSHKPFKNIENFTYFTDCSSNDIVEKKNCTVEKLHKALNDNFKLSTDTISQNFKGKIYFKFQINSAGKASNIDFFERKGLDSIQNSLSKAIQKLPKMVVIENEDFTTTTEFIMYAYISSKLPTTFKIIDLKINKTEIKKENNNKPIPFTVIENVPVYPGCETLEKSKQKNCFKQKIHKHIQKNFNYPEEAKQLGIQGRVIAFFDINKEGNITNIRTEGPHPLLELETRRIVNKIPKVIPGKQKGNPVKVPFSFPLSFRLN